MSAFRTAYTGVLAAAFVLSAGCATTHTAGNGTRRDRQGRAVTKSDAHESLEQANARLTAEADKLRRERERLAQQNAILRDELAWAHEDFKLVEKQFAVFETQLAGNYGKAAAVAATAEATMRYDRMHRERTFTAADTTAAHVRSLIDTAERLNRDQNYSAALFFAERADHIMSGAERRARLNLLPASVAVLVDIANLRSGPGQSFEVVERLSHESSLVCLDLSGEWYRVRAASGAEGWIHTSLVR